MSRKKNKNKKPKASSLPKNWKTIVLYNVQSETACFELAKNPEGGVYEPMYHKGINDWIASVTLVEGTVMGVEDAVVGDTLGFAIINKIWF
jgi:hypothetical protein